MCMLISNVQTCIVFWPNACSNRCHWSQLKDASGFNADLGFRVTSKLFEFWFSLFYLSYNNRIGGVTQFVNNDPSQGTFLFRTNLGEKWTKGLKGFNLNVTNYLMDKICQLRLLLLWVLLIVVTGISKPSLRQELDKILPLPKTTFRATSGKCPIHSQFRTFMEQ
jgi:hypothetical protein